jgi:hypothetical protein
VNTIGTAIIALALSCIRGFVDQCIEMQGFVCFHSFGGGAGAEFPKRSLLDSFLDCGSGGDGNPGSSF